MCSSLGALGTCILSKYKYFTTDPSDFNTLYNVNRSKRDLHQFLAFSVAVAGHNADSTARGIDNYLGNYCINFNLDPFEAARDDQLRKDNLIGGDMGRRILSTKLSQCGLGCSTQRARSFQQIALMIEKGFDVSKATIDELEGIHGISHKTSRFFLLYTRPNQRYAAIDTHVWKALGEHYSDRPKNIPSSTKQYRLWEDRFLKLMEDKFFKNTNMSYAEFDFYHWSSMRNGSI